MGENGIITDVHTTYRVENNQDFRFFVTPHSHCYTPDLLCIHGSLMNMTVYFNVAQAEDLIEKLRGGLKKIKEYHFKQDIIDRKEGGK